MTNSAAVDVDWSSNMSRGVRLGAHEVPSRQGKGDRESQSEHHGLSEENWNIDSYRFTSEPLHQTMMMVFDHVWP